MIIGENNANKHGEQNASVFMKISRQSHILLENLDFLFQSLFTYVGNAGRAPKKDIQENNACQRKTGANFRQQFYFVAFNIERQKRCSDIQIFQQNIEDYFSRNSDLPKYT
uniref:Uncharacterized protein n=1 Tax=Romanomermis culicivorax TaxID=13658 RepID=A0A915I055_ROMCU